MKPALLPLILLLAVLGIACEREPRPSASTPTSVATASATPSVGTRPPAGGTLATTPTGMPSAATPPPPTGPVACSILEERWRTDGLVRLTITPAAPKPGDLVTVRGTAIHAPGRYPLNVTDLDEIELKAGEVEVGSDLVINGTFVMPRVDGTHSGNRFGPCLAVSILAATAQGQRFISPMFPRP